MNKLMLFLSSMKDPPNFVVDLGLNFADCTPEFVQNVSEAGKISKIVNCFQNDNGEVIIVFTMNNEG